METAKTILEQLGNGKFIAMTGAKMFLGDNKSLQFSIPSRFAKNKINKVRIELNAMDTYDVKFYYIRGVNVKMIEEKSGVYADELRTVFTEATGLDTSL